MANEDDTASDVHNLTDFSDDEDPLRNTRNSPRIPPGGAAKVKGSSWYGDDHDMQSPSRRQLLNYRSPILQSGGSRLA